MKKPGIFLISLVLIGAVAGSLVFASCTGAEGPAGPAGPAGPQGPAGVASDEHEHASLDSIARGGRLYNKWWAELDVASPTADHPLWALQDTNTRSGSDTWRCKECHGWDYKGGGGAYSSGSHYTGFTELMTAGATMSIEDLVGVLQGSTDYRHDFSSVMSVEDLTDLANFLSEGLINDAMYIDYATMLPKVADVSNGEALYTDPAQLSCITCHGADGRQILIDDTLGLSNIALDEPIQELVHIIRSGQAGTVMISAIVNEWDIQMVLDVWSYLVTLPTE